MTGLIYKDALIEKLESNAWNIDEWELPHEQVSAGLTANAMDRETVEGMPTIDAVPVRHAKLLNAHPYGECSNCGYLIDIREEFNYCPHCGARMDKDE